MSNKLRPPHIRVTPIQFQHPAQFGHLLSFAVVGLFEGSMVQRSPIYCAYGGPIQAPNLRFSLLGGMSEVALQYLKADLMAMERQNRRIVTPGYDQSLIAFADTHPLVQQLTQALEAWRPAVEAIQEGLQALGKEMAAHGSQDVVVESNGKKSEHVVVETEEEPEG